MFMIDEKIRTICETLEGLKTQKITELDNFLYQETDYRKNAPLPDTDTFMLYDSHIGLDAGKHYWFYKKLPAQPAQDGKQLIFTLNTGRMNGYEVHDPQCIVFLNGQMVQAFDWFHRELPLPFDQENEILIHLYTESSSAKVWFAASLSLLDTKIEKLYFDLNVPYEAAMCLDDNDDNKLTILKSLELATANLDLRVPYSKAFYESVDATIGYLDTHFYKGVCGKSNTTVTCVGHTHIDVAWLWTLEQTEQKVQRSFSTVLDLMQAYPDYQFLQSQPQLYEFMKQYAPEQYAKIKQRVKEGRWEVEGGMWLEADCNISGGESLVRQFLFGKWFMKEEFDVDSQYLWLPDVFGYSAALPQIMIKCGIKGFITSKLSWNDHNKMPYDIFMWEGIDGTEVFTYFLTAQNSSKTEYDRNLTTYNGKLRPTQVLGAWRRMQQKQYCDDVLLAFGHGDGGGGPTKEMLENHKRMAYGLPGFPKTKMGSLRNFMERTNSAFRENAQLLKRCPKWVGELYFEKHRGVYTSIAKVKKNNRTAEQLYQTLEALFVTDKVLLNLPYEQEAINRGWKTILLNQFHDILPGSSIKAVYDRSDRDFAEVLGTGREMLEQGLTALSSQVKTDGGVFVYNPNGFACSDVITLDGETVYVENIPAFGYKVVTPKAAEGRVSVTQKVLENDFYRLELDDACQIVSLYDKENGREVVQKGEIFNQLQVFEDIPYYFDAWEINHYYKQKMWVIDDVAGCEIVREGARCGLKITRRYLNSVICQTIYLYDHVRRIEFDTTIDWKEEHQLLKAAFPVDIHANEAVYDIQFGNLKRPTHENTSWDKARFEVCAHKWADISDGSYGLSVINDCKYGHSAEGNILKLTLLKCATDPNPDADKEVHTFRYALIPHGGSFKDANVAQTAQLFNRPVMVRNIAKQDGILPDAYSFVSCNRENIMIDTVKKAEDSDAIIVRLYEYFDCRTEAELTFDTDVRAAYLCDMLENEQQALPVTNRRIKLNVSNFEIVTLKIIKD